MEQRAYQQLFALEDEHWWFRGRRAVIWSLLRNGGVPSAGLRVLDAGCGTGRNLLEFGSLGVARGIDTSEEAVAYCRRRGLAAVDAAPIEALPFSAGSFDLLLATDVVEHVPDDRVALRELRRVAAPDAHLLTTVPAYQWLWSAHDVELHHFRRYTWRRLRAALLDSGWEPVHWSYFNSILLAPIAAVRLLTRRQDRPIARRDDLALTPARVGALLRLALEIEARAVGAGVHLPVGVSIGAVCRAA